MNATSNCVAIIENNVWKISEGYFSILNFKVDDEEKIIKIRRVQFQILLLRKLSDPSNPQ